LDGGKKKEKSQKEKKNNIMTKRTRVMGGSVNPMEIALRKKKALTVLNSEHRGGGTPLEETRKGV